MATTTKPRKTTQRSLKVSKPINGVYSLALTDSRGEHDAYFLREIAVDFGRGFRIDKVQVKNGEDAGYDVHLDASMGDSCTCPGHTYHKHNAPCKHIAAVRKLIELRVLPAMNASQQPAETEQPEYEMRQAS
jgi:hypothetical protein